MSSDTVITPTAADLLDNLTEPFSPPDPPEPPRFTERQLVMIDGIFFRIEKVKRTGIVARPVIPYTYANGVIQICPPPEKK